MRILLLLLLSVVLRAQSGDYFQQEVSYDIRASLDDRRHELQCFLRLTYTNRAPVALDSIVFHLWPRAYGSDRSAFARQQLRNGSTRFHFSTDPERGDLDSLDFRVDDQDATFTFTRDPDIGVLLLPELLPPGDSIVVTTPFRVKIPESFSRLGRVGESYQITQWYPKPAVFDRDGWHPMPYLDQGEFYGEFGDFRVSVTVPENYVVAATGELQEAAERRWLLERAERTAAGMSNGEATAAGYVNQAFPPSAEATKTLTYTARGVHDFAWFADKRFAVLHDTLLLRSRPHEPVDVWAFFTETEANLWKNAPHYLKRATRFYSEHVGPYPYPQVTGVQSALSAGAGMEYPMITVIGRSGSSYALDEVLAHEIGHNWFYGILGSNERDHAWMDEGLNSYYEERYTRQFYPERSGRIQIIPGRDTDVNALGYRLAARLGKDQAPDTRSDSLGEMNYWISAYSKPALLLRELERELGPERLDAAFRTYYETWKFRHPQPQDFLSVMDEATGRGDYLHDALTTTDRGTFNARARRRVPAGNGRLPTIGLVTDQESERPALFVSPLAGFNANDGALLGLALHNRTLEPRRFEFLLAPLYGFGSKKLAGFAGGRYRITRPLPWLQRVVVGAGVQRFTDFRPPAIRLRELDLRYGYTRSAVKSEFFLQHPAIDRRESSFYTQLIHLRQTRPTFGADGQLLDPIHLQTNFVGVGYRSVLERAINPLAYGLRVEYRNGDRRNFTEADYLRLEGTLTGGYQYRRKKFLRWRFFGGYFLHHDARDRNTSPAYSLSLVDNAASDYRYDDLYFGRNQDGGYEQQIERRQGGFRAPISPAFNFGRSNNYLGAVNVDGDLPFPLPVSVYFDAGVYGFRPTLSSDPTNEFRWVGGLSINLFRDHFHLYLPLAADVETRRLLEERGSLLDRLSVRFNLSGLLPWRWLDDLP
ncbi:M1 family metallopeptidase [Lewinella sp. JB7]|uniref:M1 family metallopeptidase n=1 Tax=Lewinella sp. JB7 TaxID=2962887 RepID=UPI0020C93AB2|nr:M1 family metallopeptidase [Lewinella sp. JB7]MCP9236856.1 M1 family metallopeptidase [Lewinella sp. JB7]